MLAFLQKDTLLGTVPNTAILFYRKIRLVISHYLALQAYELFDGEVELDESYFGGVRKGKRDRSAGGKTAVFGMLKRHGKVYTVTVQDTKIDTLLPVIKKKIRPDSIVYTDCYRSYDVLDVSEFTHYRQSQHPFCRAEKPIKRNVSFGSTMGHRLSSLKSYGNGVKSNANLLQPPDFYICQQTLI